MRNSHRFTLGMFLILFIFPVSARAVETVGPDDYRSEFVVGNIVFVLLHEFGHLIIDDFDIPVLGNNEDAADTLAAISLIRLDRARPEKDYAYIRMLLSAADANRILWNTGLERDNPDTYGARHPLSVQRVARITCLVYGSDTDTFEPLSELPYLPEFRVDWCDNEFEDADKAWDWIRDTYIAKAEHGNLNHTVKYGNTQDPAQQKIRDQMQQREVLEKAMQIVEDTVLLPDSINLRTRSCGSPNAYWDPTDRDLVLCYELVQGFYKLSVEQKITELEQQMREFNRGE